LLSQLTNDAGYIQLEFDPVFGASEAKLFMPGDKDRLDHAITSPLTGDLDANGKNISNVGTVAGASGNYIDLPTGQLQTGFAVAAEWDTGHLADGTGARFLTNLAGRSVSELVNDAGYVTGAYTPADPTQWAGMSPATLAAMGNRLAAAYVALTGNPVP